MFEGFRGANYPRAERVDGVPDNRLGASAKQKEEHHIVNPSSQHFMNRIIESWLMLEMAHVCLHRVCMSV